MHTVASVSQFLLGMFERHGVDLESRGSELTWDQGLEGGGVRKGGSLSPWYLYFHKQKVFVSLPG